MSVANLQLCRELHGLSGWDDTEHFHYIPVNFKSTESWVRTEATYDDTKMIKHVPAYDLGYLLRKLPDEAGAQQPHIEKGVFVQKQSTTTVHMQYRAAYRYGKVKSQYADTPEDAAAKLAIELFKQGVLTPKQSKEDHHE